jgi:hypothetical protein
VKIAEPRPYADPEAAMKKLLEMPAPSNPFKMGVFTSRRSTARSYSSMADCLSNTARA